MAWHINPLEIETVIRLANHSNGWYPKGYHASGWPFVYPLIERIILVEKITKIYWQALYILLKSPLLLVWIVLLAYLSVEFSEWFLVLILITGWAMGKIDKHPYYGTKEGKEKKIREERLSHLYKTINKKE